MRSEQTFTQVVVVVNDYDYDDNDVNDERVLAGKKNTQKNNSMMLIIIIMIIIISVSSGRNVQTTQPRRQLGIK